MKLSDWFALHEKNDAWLAERIGKDRSFVTKVRNGRAVPSLATAAKIHSITGGEVTPNDFMPARAPNEGSVA